MGLFSGRSQRPPGTPTDWSILHCLPLSRRTVLALPQHVFLSHYPHLTPTPSPHDRCCVLFC